MKKTILLATALGLAFFLSLTQIQPAWAVFPLTDSGTIFGQAGAPPKKPVLKGPVDVCRFNARPQTGQIYIWLNDQQLFNRFGVKGNDTKNTAWLDLSKPQLAEVWSWSIPLLVRRVVIGDSLGESNHIPASIYLAALTTASRVLILARRQFKLEVPGKVLDKNNIHLVDVFNDFLNWPGQVKITSRLDGLLAVPDADALLSTRLKSLVKLKPISRTLSLGPGAKERMETASQLVLSQEQELSQKVQALLRNLIEPRGQEGN
ncbi:MAG: hypothetical protein JRJ59_11780 [Deltaproteobacteria bacterium]|nr:hypothetical protein [Deltaproteobacteria bacterium]